MTAEARAFVEIILLALGLVSLSCSWMLAFGLGLTVGLLTAVGLPLMGAGSTLVRSGARLVVFASGTAMACGSIYSPFTWE